MTWRTFVAGSLASFTPTLRQSCAAEPRTRLASSSPTALAFWGARERRSSGSSVASRGCRRLLLEAFNESGTPRLRCSRAARRSSSCRPGHPHEHVPASNVGHGVPGPLPLGRRRAFCEAGDQHGSRGSLSLPAATRGAGLRRGGHPTAAASMESVRAAASASAFINFWRLVSSTPVFVAHETVSVGKVCLLAQHMRLVMYDVNRRLSLMRTSKACVKRSGFGRHCSVIASVSAEQLLRAMAIHGEKADIRELLRSSEVDVSLKRALGSVLQASSSVLGTEHRSQIRLRGHAAGWHYGNSHLFVTPNLADSRAALLLQLRTQSVEACLNWDLEEPMLPPLPVMRRILSADPVSHGSSTS